MPSVRTFTNQLAINEIGDIWMHSCHELRLPDYVPAMQVRFRRPSNSTARRAVSGFHVAAPAPHNADVERFTDSEYLRDGVTEWLSVWKARGWRTADKKPVKNEDLWRQLDEAAARHHVHWQWLKGHAGHRQNERCDQLARAEIEALRKRFTPAQLATCLEEFDRERSPGKQQLGLFK